LLSNYRGVREREIILVFDAYKVPGGVGSATRHHNISVVYTKEAETADAYIEKVTYDIGKKYRVSVATSDGAIQYIILGHGALRVTPSALRSEIELAIEDVSAVIAANNRRSFGQRLKIPE
jgi:predicted RNA-binding protein with PIN domain